jgi:hypothetical protein
MRQEPVSRRALLLRINRHLQSEDKHLRQSRSNGPYILVSGWSEGGKAVLENHIELEAFARKIGVLNQFEKLEEK